MSNDLAALVFRLMQGSLLAGHGAQKLFGTFEGPGLEGTGGFMEMLGLRPSAGGSGGALRVRRWRTHGSRAAPPLGRASAS